MSSPPSCTNLRRRFGGLRVVTATDCCPTAWIEMTFECIPRRATSRRVTLACSGPATSTSRNRWTFTSEASTTASQRPLAGFAASRPLTADCRRISLRTTTADFAHDPDFPLTLVFNRSKHRFVEPWCFGVSHGQAYVQMFRPQDRVRLTQSPSGGGQGNPAWDFQFFIEKLELNRRYQFVMRAMLLPYESADQVERDTRSHRESLSSGRKP